MDEINLLALWKAIRKNELNLSTIDLNQQDVKGNTLLHVAVKEGDEKTVNQLLNARIAVNTLNYHCISPLDYACYKGHEDIIELLLGRKATINMLGRSGATLLHVAAQYGLKKTADLLLQCDMSITACDEYGRTPLQYAVEHQQQAMTEWLLNKTSNVRFANHQGLGVLEHAVYYEWVSTVKLLLESGGSVNHSDNAEGITLLHIAAQQGHVEVVKFLISKGVDVNAGDKVGSTALYYAITSGQQDVALLLLSQDAAFENNYSHIAAEKGYTKVVAGLLKKDIDINAIDENNLTPLYYAIAGGSAQTVQLLLNQHNIDLDVKHEFLNLAIRIAGDQVEIVQLLLDKLVAGSFGAQDKTSLYSAIYANNVKIVAFLLSRNANVLVKDDYGDTPLHIASRYNRERIVPILMQYGADLEASNNERQTPLQTAIKSGAAEVIRYLLDHGAKIDVCDQNGNTVLDAAVATVVLQSEKVAKIIELLIQRGARKTITHHPVIMVALYKHGIIQIEYNAKWLHEAVLSGEKEIVQSMIENGTDVNTYIEKWDVSLLLLAILNKQEDITALLIEKGADVNWRDMLGSCPLVEAASWGNRPIVQRLLHNGVNIDAMNQNEKENALHIASVAGHAQVVSLLLEQNASMRDKFDHYGQNALHLAVIQNHADVIRVLLEAGSSVNEKNYDGNTPLQLAVSYRNMTAMWLLIVEGKANINIKNDKGHTPLIQAMKNYEEMCKNNFFVGDETDFLQLEMIAFLLAYQIKQANNLVDVLMPDFSSFYKDEIIFFQNKLVDYLSRDELLQRFTQFFFSQEKVTDEMIKFASLPMSQKIFIEYCASRSPDQLLMSFMPWIQAKGKLPFELVVAILNEPYEAFKLLPLFEMHSEKTLQTAHNLLLSRTFEYAYQVGQSQTESTVDKTALRLKKMKVLYTQTREDYYIIADTLMWQACGMKITPESDAEHQMVSRMRK